MAAPFEFKSDQNVSNQDQSNTQFGNVYGGTISGVTQTPITALDVAYLTGQRAPGADPAVPAWAFLVGGLALLGVIVVWIWRKVVT